MTFRIVFYSDIRGLSYPLYELKRIQNNQYIVRNIPLSVRGHLFDYENRENCKFFYFYDRLDERDKKLYQSYAVELVSQPDGTVSMSSQDTLGKSKVKKYL